MNIIFILENYVPFISMRQLENKQKKQTLALFTQCYIGHKKIKLL